MSGWRASRVDVSAATATYQRSAIRRARPLLRRRVDEVGADDVAALVAALFEEGKSRETVRKTITVLAMVFDHAGVTPNPQLPVPWARSNIDRTLSASYWRSSIALAESSPSR